MTKTSLGMKTQGETLGNQGKPSQKLKDISENWKEEEGSSMRRNGSGTNPSGPSGNLGTSEWCKREWCLSGSWEEENQANTNISNPLMNGIHCGSKVVGRRLRYDEPSSWAASSSCEGVTGGSSKARRQRQM